MVHAYHNPIMPKQVDHDARQRQITDAVCRITQQGGLGAATFRQVAAEAGMSVRSIQYYFGTKDHLLDVTLQHVGERSIARLTTWIEATDGSPRAVLGAFLKSFVPSDEESYVSMLMYLALGAENAVGTGPRAATLRSNRQSENQMMLTMIAEQLNRGSLVEGVNPEHEAAVITAMMPGLGNFLVEGTLTAAEVFLTIDYHLDRLFATEPSRQDPTNDNPPTITETKKRVSNDHAHD